MGEFSPGGRSGDIGNSKALFLKWPSIKDLEIREQSRSPQKVVIIDIMGSALVSIAQDCSRKTCSLSELSANWRVEIPLGGQLWIADALRRKHYGTTLMHKAEELAREQGANFMAVNTFDWQALDFYKKLGFYVEFERKGFDRNSTFYFLRKDLT